MPHAARSERRPRLDPAPRHGRAERRPRATATSSPSSGPGFVPGRAGRHRPVRPRSRRRGPRAARRHRRLQHRHACSTPTPTTTAWPPAPSRCSASSRRRPPARSTARSRPSAASSRWAPSATTTAPAASASPSRAAASRSTSRPSRVAPAEGLADGDVVHVEGEGFEPDAPVTLSVCSIDPAGCWSTGEPIELDGEEVQDARARGRVRRRQYVCTGLLADGDGRVSGDVPVWRFLPGPDPGLVRRLRGERVPPAGRPPRSATRPAPADRSRFAARRRRPAAARRRGRPHPGPRSPATRSWCGGRLPAGHATSTCTLCAAPAERPEQRACACSGDGGDEHDRRRRRLRRPVRGARPWRHGRVVDDGMATTTTCSRDRRRAPASPASTPAAVRRRRSSSARSGSRPTRTATAAGPPQFVPEPVR